VRAALPTWATLASSSRLRGGRELIAIAGLSVGAILVGSLLSDYQIQQFSLWIIYGILALSLTFVWGAGGIFSLGQQVFFAVGGYAYAIIAINLMPHSGETVTAALGGIVVAALFAGIVGYFVLYGEVSEVAVAIITLALSLVIYTLMATTAGPEYHLGDAQLGGYNGVVGVPPLIVGLPGSTGEAVSLRGMLLAAVVVAAVLTALLSRLRQAPFGRVLAAVRQNEERAELLGYDVRVYRWMTFVIGGAIAGAAGTLFAAWGTFIDPTTFALQQAVLVVIWVLVGGRGSLLGAFVGVAFVQWLSDSLGGSGAEITPIVLGAALIGVVLVLPAGLVPTAAALLRRTTGRWERERAGDAASDESPGALPIEPPIALSARQDAGDLILVNASKAFGGVTAVRDVDLTFPSRGVECLIGPNGAGKSTLFGLLAGRLRPTSGDVLLSGKSIKHLRRYRRARLGIGTKLQVASLFPELTCEENLWLAVYARHHRPTAAGEGARSILRWLGMEDRAGVQAGVLAHGEQQWLEIGVVLANEPAVILLDEPTAGMTEAETERTAQLIARLADHASVIVVEHDMEFLRLLGAPVTVLHQGQIFARGSLDEMREHAGVLDIYLGRPADVAT
jgi:branched-chain amino acid transport system permease protein